MEGRREEGGERAGGKEGGGRASKAQPVRKTEAGVGGPASNQGEWTVAWVGWQQGQ